jgi:gliding motility-associated-like protein
LTAGTSYTVTAGNGSCSSVASSSFSIAAQLTAPSVPTVSTTAPTCSADGSATISNYSGSLTYTFSPTGPSAGALGVISGITAGTNYTVTAGNGSCTSVTSSSFSIATQLSTPTVPTVSTTTATCSADGSATISNYSGSLTYTFSPTGPTAGALGAISGMTAGTSYTVTAGNGSCTSVSSSSFSIAAQLTVPPVPTITTVAATCSAAGIATISNYDAGQTYTFTPSGPSAGVGGSISGMTAGTSSTVTATNASTCTSVASSLFGIAAQLTTPSAPTVTTLAATCLAVGTATISNYDAGQTYTFTPGGPTAGAGGVISGMTAGTSYTVTTTNASTCTSVSSASFSIAAQLTTPSTPTVSTVAATCSAAGTATISNYNAGQTYTFTPGGPTAGAGGVISGMTAGTSYTVTTTNASTCTSVASASFSIANPLCNPTANDNSASTNEEQPVIIITIQSNDTDVDGNVVTSTIDLDPTTPGQQTTITTSEGTWVLNTTTGNVTFTPVANYNGTATIPYTIEDNVGLISNTANIIVTVIPLNDGPVVDNDSNTISEDGGPATGDLTDVGDSDPDGTTLTVDTTPVSGPSNGTITINADGTYSYTPNAGFNGQDTIVVSVCDNGLPLPVICVNDTLIITVTPVNDEPIVDNDSNTISEDGGPATGDLTDAGDSDPDGTPLTVDTTPVSGPSNGTITINADGTYSYTPNAGFNGQDTIIVSVCDNGLPLPVICVNDTLIITVTPVNDEPVVDNDSNTITEDGGPATGDLTDAGDSDPDGTPLTVDTTPVSGPSNGTITINADGTYSYTPNAGFNGQDTIIVSVCDTGLPLPAICVNDTLIITVTPVNDEPIVDNDSNTISEDGGPATGDLTDVGDSDPDGTTLTVDITPVSEPSNGTITINADGTYSYTPNAGFNGQDTIIVSVCDTGLPLPVICVNDTLIITVTPVNDGPVVDNDSNTISEDGGPATGDLTDVGDSDPDGTTLTVDTTPVSGPSNGTITINADGTYSYTPNAGFNGQDTIIVSVCDTGLPLPAICVNDTLIITVTPVNDGPNATIDIAATTENNSVVISILTNDTDSDGNIDSTSVTIIDSPSNGTVTVDPITGSITYTPNAGFTGTDTLIYQVCDDGTPLPEICDTAIVIITVLSCQTDLTADCDGDGVTNGEEVDPDGDGIAGPNGTDPSDPCSFDVTNQDIGSVSQAWLDADCDGDGVTNGEEVDPDGDGIAGPNGTDPSDPCSFDVTNQDLGSVSQAWLDADCDGDGVTNGEEVDPDGDGIAGPNGTDPSDPCSFESANQDLGSVSQAWLDADCDGDGVTNGQEVIDGTDPNNPCSLLVASQTETPSQAWIDSDCDDDGLTNGVEVSGGSNPFDPCDPNSCDSDITIPQAFTPDGDNTNDTFVIPGIENYPKNKLTIYNRWGNEVFFAEGYYNTWNGTANRGIVIGDAQLPTGTYYYILDLNGDGETIYKGYVYLKR